VVSVAAHRSFVVADIPGLIEGAAEGLGLGIRFLKHLARTRLLLHIVDIAPLDDLDPAHAADKLLAELDKFDPQLATRPRWLVFNKTDLLAADALDAHCDDLLERLDWQGPHYRISAIGGSGTDILCRDIMNWMEQQPDDATPVEQDDAT
jgi:GTP-binding protein